MICRKMKLIKMSCEYKIVWQRFSISLEFKCPAKFQNVWRGTHASPDNMAGEANNISRRLTITFNIHR